jgi:hypothetical protein
VTAAGVPPLFLDTFLRFQIAARKIMYHLIRYLTCTMYYRGSLFAVFMINQEITTSAVQLDDSVSVAAPYLSQQLSSERGRETLLCLVATNTEHSVAYPLRV